MYIIIKKDKAEHLSEKLHKAKELVSEILTCMEEVSERSYAKEDLFGHEDTRRGRVSERIRHHFDDEDDEDFYERDMARRGRMRAGRGRY